MLLPVIIGLLYYDTTESAFDTLHASRAVVYIVDDMRHSPSGGGGSGWMDVEEMPYV